MNTPQIFNFEQNEVRTILVNDEPYFVGKDVASGFFLEILLKSLFPFFLPHYKMMIFFVEAHI
ncbi:hypothetical protein EfmAA94_07990 [Enterococcus faecium]|nr:hypothetical protein EfmAA94_07990 [Enterococcus faecium]